MYPSNLKAAESYRRINVETGVQSASPHKLILMLFDGAIFALNNAALQMKAKETARKGESISTALDIIALGLKASLNIEQGGELADRLMGLYDYMSSRLLYANLKNDEQALQEVLNLLGELRSAWAEIANDPAVLSANQAAA